jgi:hypothetical protein
MSRGIEEGSLEGEMERSSYLLSHRAISSVIAGCPLYCLEADLTRIMYI